MKRFVVPLFTLLGAIGFVLSVWTVFTNTPLQYSIRDGLVEGTSLFFNQKIYYFHVPHAFGLFLAVGVAGVCSIGYLKTRNPKWDDVAVASVEVAAAYGAVVCVTGAIWAKASWEMGRA